MLNQWSSFIFAWLLSLDSFGSELEQNESDLRPLPSWSERWSSVLSEIFSPSDGSALAAPPQLQGCDPGGAVGRFWFCPGESEGRRLSASGPTRAKHLQPESHTHASSSSSASAHFTNGCLHHSERERQRNWKIEPLMRSDFIFSFLFSWIRLNLLGFEKNSVQGSKL